MLSYNYVDHHDLSHLLSVVKFINSISHIEFDSVWKENSTTSIFDVVKISRDLIDHFEWCGLINKTSFKTIDG